MSSDERDVLVGRLGDVVKGHLGPLSRSEVAALRAQLDRLAPAVTSTGGASA